MHYQMFFPGASGGAAAVLRAADLGDLAECCKESMAKFDDGRPGLLISWTGDVGYLPDRQQWVPLGADDDPLIGYWIDDPCTPADLKRRRSLNGYETRLADDRTWVIPNAAELPATLRLVDRVWTKVRKPQFDEFWSRSESWYRRFMQGLDIQQAAASEKLSPDTLLHDWVNFCVYALRQNYRILPQIASHMGLLDTNSLIDITCAVVDGMAIKEVIQEMQAAAS